MIKIRRRTQKEKFSTQEKKNIEKKQNRENPGEVVTLEKGAADKISSRNNNRNRVVEEENVLDYEEETGEEEMDESVTKREKKIENEKKVWTVRPG